MGQEWAGPEPAGLFSWSSEIWSWSPEHVRWTLDLGLPTAPVFFEVSTDQFPVEARYDSWRKLLYYSFEGDPLPEGAAQAFTARTSCLISDPVQLVSYSSSAVSGRGVPADRADDRETYTLGVVEEGERRYEQEGARPAVSRPGEFFVFDNRWHSRVTWSDHAAVQLSVRRADLEQRIGGAIPEPVEMMALLEAAEMGQMLKGQIRLAAKHMAGMRENEREFLLAQLLQLTMFACETATAANAYHAPQRRDLWSAAITLIERNLGRPAFGAKALQSQLGCSRATLYRAFAEKSTSVSEQIANMRVARAKVMLSASPDMPINIVAARCGWYDSASFARAFRRHTGLSPSGFREQLLAG